jgi:hypothetical protein
MTQVALSPVFNDTQFSDNSGLPLAGGKIFTYEAGSNSVLQLTYTTIDGVVEQTNPVVLDSSGRLPNEMWLINGSAYNLVLTQADGTTVITSVDNVRGSMPVPPGGGLGTVIWNPAESVPAFISSAEFSIEGALTTNYAVGNRVRYQFDDLSYGYATVTNVVYSAPDTFVTLAPDSIGFSNTVINVAWSALVSTNMTVDAAGVSFTPVVTYAGNNVGAELQSLRTLIVNNATVWDTTGTAPDYVVTPTVAATNYIAGKWSVHFTAVSTGGACTLNISNVFQAPLKQYSPSGTLVDAVISAEMISDVAWDDVNSVFILLNPLPSTPTGTIMWYTGITAPAGWAICNGDALSAAAQPALFAVLGYTFGGAGDSFSVPNLLGQFIRGFDSSEAVDPGRVFGSTQTGQMESHHHNMWWVNYDGGGGRGLVDPVNPLNITTAGQSTSGYTGWGVDFAGTGTETRPTNVALTPCIKY